MAWLGIFLRGLMMGAADIVPGVSGGTVAFITGIYDRLLAAIRAFDLRCLTLLLSGNFHQAYQRVDGTFLFALLAGIATSVLGLARGIGWLLDHHPLPLWAFFFGLILASALALMRHVRQWTPSLALALLVGIVAAVLIALSTRVSLDGGYAMVFLAGFLAICAMILPGISGSFILLLLGMYQPVLTAINELNLVFIAVFALGAISGLMAFSRLLYFLLHRFHQHTMALLTGFLTGSLSMVWPWKEVTEWVTDSHGVAKAARMLPLSPSDYQLATGESAQLLLCLLLMLIGFVLVWLVETRIGHADAEN